MTKPITLQFNSYNEELKTCLEIFSARSCKLSFLRNQYRRAREAAQQDKERLSVLSSEILRREKEILASGGRLNTTESYEQVAPLWREMESIRQNTLSPECMESIKNVINGHRDFVAKLSQEIKLLKANPPLEQKFSDVRKKLRGSPHVVKNSIRFSSGRLQWVLKGVVFTVKNPYNSHCFNKGAPIRILLPDVRVTLTVSSFSLQLTPATPGQSFMGYVSSFPGGVFPHITGTSGECCLGDWKQPLRESFSRGDIELFNTLLTMYLSVVDGTDSAGKYWPNWLMQPEVRRNQKKEEMFYKIGGNHDFFYTTEEGVVYRVHYQKPKPMRFYPSEEFEQMVQEGVRYKEITETPNKIVDTSEV